MKGKLLSLFLYVVYSQVIVAQTMTGATIEVRLEQDAILVREILSFDTPDSIKRIQLSAIDVGAGVNLEEILTSGFRTTPLRQVNLYEMDLVWNAPSAPLRFGFSYRVDRNDPVTVPIFFPKVGADDASAEFCSLKVFCDPETHLEFSFPFGEKAVNSIDELRLYQWQLQALPSMLRFKEHNQPVRISTYDTIDMLVAVLLLVIGWFIWKNRSKLSYG